MRKSYLSPLVLGVYIILIFSWGCGIKNTPKDTVFRFISAIRTADVMELEKTLSFERLLIEKEGEAYVNLNPEGKQQALDKFKDSLLRQLTSGNLRYLGDLDIGVKDERVSEDVAEVVVINRKINSKTYSFTLAREDGVWRIYKIAGI